MIIQLYMIVDLGIKLT